MLRRWTGFFDRQIGEIRDDPALRAFGVVGGALEVLTAFWAWYGGRVYDVSSEAEGICWPFFQNCGLFRVLDASALWLVIATIGSAGLGAATLFARGKVRGGYWLLWGALILKTAYLLLDFRLRANQHYMAIATTLVFLLVSHKRDALRILVALFYFWAGILKLNAEWLSGSALYQPLWLIHGAWIPVACAYVVVMEVGLIWGILTRVPWLFWATFAQLVLFHVMSWPVVGYFYPVLMGFIISIFPLTWLFRAHKEPVSLLRQIVRFRARRTVYGVMAVFSLLQVIHYGFPGDAAVTGEGRFMALHMFDARVDCVKDITVHYGDGSREQLPDLDLRTRLRCDPYVMFAQAKRYCTKTGVRDVDMSMNSRRSSEPDLHVVVAETEICERGLRYDWWRHNAWIRTGE